MSSSVETSMSDSSFSSVLLVAPEIFRTDCPEGKMNKWRQLLDVVKFPGVSVRLCPVFEVANAITPVQGFFFFANSRAISNHDTMSDFVKRRVGEYTRTDNRTKFNLFFPILTTKACFVFTITKTFCLQSTLSWAEPRTPQLTYANS